MAELTPAQMREYERLREIKDRVADEYLDRSGVRAVGVGFKEVGGRATDVLAIRFYVARKRAAVGPDALPAQVEGVPTDVIEADFQFGPFPGAGPPEDSPAAESLPDEEVYDPLVGGISIGPERKINGVYGNGTEGVMVEDGAEDGDGRPMMLSNAHVMCGSDGNARVGDEIYQPSPGDRIIWWPDNCAKLTRWYLGNWYHGGQQYGVDAAVAERTHREVDLRTVVEIGVITGTTAARVGMVVLKRGRTTGLTKGEVTDIAAKGKDDSGVEFQNLVEVKGLDGPFTQSGDSGALVVEEGTLRAVSLHAFHARGTDRSLGCAIDPVLDVLNVRL